MKPCLDCGAATKGSVCTRCRAQRELARGTTTQRGYGTEHQAEKRRWQIRMEHGELVLCARCHLLPFIDPYRPWALDHTDDRTGYLGPSHLDCNSGASRRKTREGLAL